MHTYIQRKQLGSSLVLSYNIPTVLYPNVPRKLAILIGTKKSYLLVCNKLHFHRLAPGNLKTLFPSLYVSTCFELMDSARFCKIFCKFLSEYKASHTEKNFTTQRGLTFRQRASCIQDRRFATLQRTLFTYLINKYISLSDVCLTVHH